MDQRFVAQVGRGSEGTLAFTADSVARTWRYTDIDSIGSSRRFQLTIATLEKSLDFQLKQPIAKASYNHLWLRIEKENGRIQ